MHTTLKNVVTKIF